MRAGRGAKARLPSLVPLFLAACLSPGGLCARDDEMLASARGTGLSCLVARAAGFNRMENGRP